jgi:hypothetical protein
LAAVSALPRLRTNLGVCQLPSPITACDREGGAGVVWTPAAPIADGSGNRMRHRRTATGLRAGRSSSARYPLLAHQLSRQYPFCRLAHATVGPLIGRAAQGCSLQQSPKAARAHATGAPGCGWGPLWWGCVRRCPTLPHPGGCSTIGAGGLSFRVRDGSGRFPSAMAAVTRVELFRVWCARAPGTAQWMLFACLW